MKTALVFPGQGSQVVGMGKQFSDNFPEAARVFAEVDDALEQKLSEIIFNGPQEVLTLTANAQPAIMACSIAILKTLQKELGLGIEYLAEFVAGHSLGEYSALCAAGAISLYDTAKLVRIRGEAMQNEVAPGIGAMAAVLAMDLDKVNSILKEISKDSFICEIANDNCSGQIVISGHLEAVNAACEKIIAEGSKVVKLPVSAPFHCSLMLPVAKVMSRALNNCEILALKVPLISNVTADIVIQPELIKDSLLSQISGTVRWRESIIRMKELGVGKIIEVGAGKVLSGINKRIDSNLILGNISSIEDLKILVN